MISHYFRCSRFTAAFPRRVFGKRDHCAKGPEWMLRYSDWSESFLQLDVPEPAFDRSKRFVVAVLDVAGYKRRVFVENVLHPKRDRGVVKPPLPIAAAILGCRNGHEVFLLAILHLYVFSAILDEAGHLRSSGGWQVERVGRNQIQRDPLPHFPRAPR